VFAIPSLGQHVAVCAHIAHAIFNRLRETHRPRASAHRDSAPPPTTFVDPPFFAVVGHDDKVEHFWVPTMYPVPVLCPNLEK